jgi:adenosylcobinamide-GDP ribazoletransferase
MGFLPPARPSGLSVAAGRPSLAVAAVSATLGIVALCPLGLPAMPVAIFLLAGWAAALGWLAMRQIAGHTGDVLGALEQGGEVLVLLAAVGSRSA